MICGFLLGVPSKDVLDFVDIFLNLLLAALQHHEQPIGKPILPNLAIVLILLDAHFEEGRVDGLAAQ